MLWLIHPTAALNVQQLQLKVVPNKRESYNWLETLTKKITEVFQETILPFLSKKIEDLDQLNQTRTHHEEGVADPQAAPARRTLWDCDVLAVDGNGHWRSLAHRAAADVRFDVSLLYGHHGQRSCRWQPIGLVISAGIVTEVSRIAVQEGHGAEPAETGAGQTWKQPTNSALTKCKTWDVPHILDQTFERILYCNIFNYY